MTDRLLLRNATAWLDGVLREGTSIAIEGRHILEVSQDRDAGAPHAEVVTSDVPAIDLGGRVVLPGLTLCHFHCDYRSPSWPVPSVRDEREGVLMAGAVAAAVALLRSGFTGYVGSGCLNNNDAQLEAVIGSGVVEGPHIRPCGTQIRLPDAHQPVGAIVREQMDAGARVLKLFLTAGHGVYGPRSITDEELATVVEAAHRRGVLVRAHCVGRDQIVRGITAGLDLIDHGDEVDDECIELFVERGTYWAPSALFHWAVLGGHDRPVDPDWVADANETLERFTTILPAADAAGVKIVLGDDYGISLLPHEVGVHARELALYSTELGCSTASVFRWATRNGAELLGLEDRAGRIAPGERADLVIVDGDPLADPTVLQHADLISAVMKDGRFVDGSWSMDARRVS